MITIFVVVKLKLAEWYDGNEQAVNPPARLRIGKTRHGGKNLVTCNSRVAPLEWSRTGWSRRRIIGLVCFFAAVTKDKDS